MELSPQSILTPNAKFRLNVDMSDSSPVRYQPHQSLSDVLDFIILVQKTNMPLDYGFCISFVRGSNDTTGSQGRQFRIRDCNLGAGI